jgi:hypothetical protein
MAMPLPPLPSHTRVFSATVLGIADVRQLPT